MTAVPVNHQNCLAHLSYSYYDEKNYLKRVYASVQVVCVKAACVLGLEGGDVFMACGRT